MLRIYDGQAVAEFASTGGGSNPNTPDGDAVERLKEVGRRILASRKTRTREKVPREILAWLVCGELPAHAHPFIDWDYTHYNHSTASPVVLVRLKVPGCRPIFARVRVERTARTTPAWKVAWIQWDDGWAEDAPGRAGGGWLVYTGDNDMVVCEGFAAAVAIAASAA